MLISSMDTAKVFRNCTTFASDLAKQFCSSWGKISLAIVLHDLCLWKLSRAFVLSGAFSLNILAGDVKRQHHSCAQ